MPDPTDQHRAHVAAVLTAAGVGFVAEAERERDEWAFDHSIVEHWQERAERAEAALADLRVRVGALCLSPDHARDIPVLRRVEYVSTDRLRALLDTEADQ